MGNAGRRSLKIEKREEESIDQQGKKKVSHIEEWAKINIKFLNKDGSVSSGILENDEKLLKISVFSIVDVIRLLIEAAESQTKSIDLIHTCWKLNMSRSRYINVDNDPLYSNGSSFIFDCNNDEIGRLEIIDVNGKLLQLGFQIIYKPRLFTIKINKDFVHLRRWLYMFYRDEYQQTVLGVKVYNFANAVSQCYVSKSKVNRKWTLNFRIMNKVNWRLLTFGNL